MYVIVGFSLILVVSYVYLATILPCIPGLLYQTLHLASGAVLLVNIILNYWLCTRTRPGSTASLKEVLQPVSCFWRILCSKMPEGVHTAVS